MNQQQENKLEALIPKAAAEPAYRPEFFRVLLESEVYVISDYGQADEGHGYLTDGDSLSILAMPLDENTQIIRSLKCVQICTRLSSCFTEAGFTQSCL